MGSPSQKSLLFSILDFTHVTSPSKELNEGVKNLRLKEKSQLIGSSNTENGFQNNDHFKTSTCRYVYHRVFGYSVGAIVHIGNILAMFIALRGPILEDPDVKFFYSMQYIYITIWDLGFQLLYISMGFACDFPILLDMKSSKFISWLRRYRKTYYNGILWPCGLIIFTIFWPTYIYDRNLIFPDYIDKALSQVSNYIMHMFIVFPIVWDLFFLPNQKPNSQKYILSHVLGVFFLYNIVLFGHYGYRGQWPYPVLKVLYGTVYFPLVFIVISITLAIIYVLQWPIISWTWRSIPGKAT